MTGDRPLKGRTSRAIAIALVAGLTLASCSGGTFRNARGNIGFGDTPIEAYTAEQIYERGEYELERNAYGEAAEFFSEIERLYPYSEWAKRALIMQAFAHHKDKEYEEARAVAQRDGHEGEKRWREPPWSGRARRDNVQRALHGGEVI